MKRIPLLLVVFIFFGCSQKEQVKEDAVESSMPNIVIIVSDDQGYGDLSLTGNPYISTPNIDKMASEGAFFRHFYVSPVCSPTRAEMLTGRYHVRGGVYDTSEGGERLDLDEETIAEVFRSAGYTTGAFGKWHNGQQYPYHPNGRGFDEFYGFAAGHWGNYFDALMERNGEYVQGKGYMPDDLTDNALKFIETNREQPFFLYIPYNTPHSPMQVPDQYWNKFKDLVPSSDHRQADQEKINHTRAAYAMCENLDYNVGRVLEKIDEMNLAENTIIMYFSDNGPNGRRWNADLRGTKGSTDEGGVRSPLVMQWKGHIPPGTEVKQVSAAIDLLPTLTSMSGIDFEPKKPLDGIDLSSQILEEASAKERLLINHWAGRVSVRTQQFRLDYENRLYDIDADPGQFEELPSSPMKDSLIAIKEQWSERVRTETPEKDTRPFPIAGTDYVTTIMPARDAHYSEGIDRSNRWPNDSFLMNWESTGDSIYWNVEVLEPGNFEVILHYTTPAENVGAVLAVQCQDAETSSTIQQPFDPPLRGAENDRFERGESYVKDFRAVSIGELSLDKGPSMLVLKALEKTGPGIIDFRMLEFKRIAQ